jgi:hypothetical protein
VNDATRAYIERSRREAGSFRAAWEDKEGNDDHGRGGFKEGDRVAILTTHWDKSIHGHQGVVKSTAQSTEGKTTHYVKLDKGRGQFVHASELAARTTGREPLTDREAKADHAAMGRLRGIK